jgi:hypothetical protein
MTPADSDSRFIAPPHRDSGPGFRIGYAAVDRGVAREGMTSHGRGARIRLYNPQFDSQDY